MKPTTEWPATPPGTQRPSGFSIIELLVSMAIGLILTLAVSRVLIYSQESKLTTTTLNDTNQTGNYLAYAMDRAVRSAGSGYAQQRRNFGCLLNASRGSTAILPRSAALPAEFASVTGPFRLAPVVIFNGASSAGSDVLMVMTGAAGYGESGLPLITGKTTTSQIQIPNTVGFRPDSILLLADDNLPGCMVQQISSSFADPGDQTLPLAGTYFKATGSTVNLVDFGVSGTSYAMALGQVSATANNPPDFKLYGVGQNSTLFSYDLLQFDGSNLSVPVADGVVEMHAIYNVDTDGDDKADAWRDPGASPSVGYSAANLLDGSVAARDRLATIMAVRIGFILRTSLAEKTPPAISRDSYTLFNGVTGITPITRTLSASEKSYRFRTLEITIPVRNLLM